MLGKRKAVLVLLMAALLSLAWLSGVLASEQPAQAGAVTADKPAPAPAPASAAAPPAATAPPAADKPAQAAAEPGLITPATPQIVRQKVKEGLHWAQTSLEGTKLGKEDADLVKKKLSKLEAETADLEKRLGAAAEAEAGELAKQLKAVKKESETLATKLNAYQTYQDFLKEGDKVKGDKYRQNLEKAIALTLQGSEPKEPGYLGLLGAPSTPWWVGLLWAIWVGWIFSTVGAFGGIMAGVGHITVFGLGDYASKFGKGHPVNNMITDSIRVSNQWLVGLSGLISSINYYKMGRLVLPLGVCLAIGGVGGSWLVPELTAGKVSLKAYIGYFGLCVLALGCILLYETTPRGQAKKKEAKAAAQAFEKAAKEGGDTADQGVKIVEGAKSLMWLAVALVVLSAVWVNMKLGSLWVAYVLVLAGWALTFFLGTIRFTFFGQEFKFKAWVPMVGGIVIAALASFLGVGGGFLYVPFLTSVAGLPMFLVAGTSALAVLVGMIASIVTYMTAKGVVVQWGLIGAELVGIFIGSMIGPRTSKYIPDKWLKIIFIILAFYVGILYASKGFTGSSWLPPY